MSTTYRAFLLIWAISSACSSGTQPKDEPAQADNKPNIIFIMADDLGYGSLGAYGQQVIKTPNIDRLAAEGMKFTQCYSGSSVCAPARSVLMTGRHTGHTTVRGNFGEGGVVGLAGNPGRVPLRQEDITIAEKMREAGYVTGMVGKWGLGEPNTTGEPNDQGFDEFYGFLNQRRAHKYYPDYLWKNKEKVQLTRNSNGVGAQYTHDLFADQALDFINKNKEKPFFLYLPLCIPHNDYEVPDLGMYKDEEWSHEARAYAAMISRMDMTVGRIMKALKDYGIDEETIIFFTSDNGAAEVTLEWDLFDDNAPLRGVKRDPYEGGIRVPMIVRYPGVVAEGTISDLPWYFADVLPTLTAIGQVEEPENIDGVSIWPTLTGQKQDLSSRHMYWEFYELEGWRTVRFGDWKAIQHNMHAEQHTAIELYNLADDIGETNNLAAQNPELVAQAAELFEEAHVPSPYYKWKFLSESDN
ncbi:MAG: arylsulfatase [Bacteroidota bacterium]